uniref:YDG domain-containing protein n=1 Tax=Mycena chlorophos TaxID=658473 RepID=A0ABQ0LHP0_MYCCL|nr:predicted protein [Mycena chlorophos]
MDSPTRGKNTARRSRSWRTAGSNSRRTRSQAIPKPAYIQNLPNELLTEIFMRFLPQYPAFPPLVGPNSPTCLLGVCRRWRNLALHTARLWRAIKVDGDADEEFAVALTWLERSSSALLYLDVVVDDDVIPATHPPLQQLFEAIVANRMRWQYLKLAVQEDQAGRFSGPAPNLACLEISASGDGWDPAHSFLLVDAAALRELVLWDAAYNVQSVPWAQLTSLTILLAEWLDMHPVLPHCINLIYCKISFWNLDDEDSDLPRLNICLPHLKILIVLLETDGHGRIPELEALIERSQCKLRSLQIAVNVPRGPWLAQECLGSDWFKEIHVACVRVDPDLDGYWQEDEYWEPVPEPEESQEPRFGNIPNVPVGQCFENRKALRDAGVHIPLQAGIWGTETDGACSIVASGGYADDVDKGNTIIYTGEGTACYRTRYSLIIRPGQGPLGASTKKSDQVWKGRNLALKRSMERRLRVRVVRGSDCGSKFAPKHAYRYDGLYLITKAWTATGKEGLKVCQVQLVRLPNQPPIPTRHPTGTTIAQISQRVVARSRRSSPSSSPPPEEPPGLRGRHESMHARMMSNDFLAPTRLCDAARRSAFQAASRGRESNVDVDDGPLRCLAAAAFPGLDDDPMTSLKRALSRTSSVESVADHPVPKRAKLVPSPPQSFFVDENNDENVVALQLHPQRRYDLVGTAVQEESEDNRRAKRFQQIAGRKRYNGIHFRKHASGSL